MALTDTFNGDYISALKERKADLVDTLRYLRSALKNEEIDQGKPLDDTQVIVVLAREAKRRKEAIEQYQNGGRPELADKESAELTVIESYLPKSMIESELTKLVDEAIAESGAIQKSDMGKVMANLKQKLSNPADISRAAGLVNQKLTS